VGYPFNPVRGRIVTLANRIAKCRGQEASNLLAKLSQRKYPVQLDDIWPEGFAELALASGAQYSRSSQEWTEFEPTKDVSNRQVLSLLEEELGRRLEEQFRDEILDCISTMLSAGFLDTSIPSQMKLFQIYSAAISQKIPGIATDPSGKTWISCHMDERKTVTPTANDVLRYLEGFIVVMDWKALFCGSEPQPGEIGSMAAKILGPATVRLALASSLLIKAVYVDPLAELSREIPVYEKTHSVEVSLDALILESLRTRGKALAHDDVSRSRCAYYSDFTGLLVDLEARAAASEGVNRLIAEIHDCLDKLYACPYAPDLLSESGARDFLDYFASLVGQGDITEVKSITTPFMRAARTEYLKLFQKAGGLERMRGRKRGLGRPGFQERGASSHDALSAANPQYDDQAAFHAGPSSGADYQKTEPTQDPLPSHRERDMIHHKSLHVPVCILASRVAAVKVLEEAYPLTFHSHFGRLAEQKGMEQLSKLVDPHGVILNGLSQLLRVKGWEKWSSCEIQPGQ